MRIIHSSAKHILWSLNMNEEQIKTFSSIGIQGKRKLCECHINFFSLFCAEIIRLSDVFSKMF